jgi:hypothetical protein
MCPTPFVVARIGHVGKYFNNFSRGEISHRENFTELTLFEMWNIFEYWPTILEVSKFIGWLNSSIVFPLPIY